MSLTRINHTAMKPRRESQRAERGGTEVTEEDSVLGSVNSVSELRALCDKNILKKSVMNAG